MPSLESSVQTLLQPALAWIAGLGPLGPFAYAGLYLFGSVCLLPCFPLTVGAGFIFGFPRGFLLASVSSTLGATGAFLVSRYVARAWLSGWMAENRTYKVLDRAVTREGAKIVLLARFASHLPYNVVNYLFGLTGISLGPFVLATWIGRIPITALHTYVGSLAADLTAIHGELPPITSLEWTLYGFGWLATIIIAIYLAGLARTALGEKTESD